MTIDRHEEPHGSRPPPEVVDRYRHALAQSAVAACLLDPDGRILEGNQAACELLGRDAHDLARFTLQGLLHVDDVEGELRHRAGIPARGTGAYHLVNRYVRPDGSLVHGDQDVSAVRDGCGRLVGYLALIVNVDDSLRLRALTRHAREQLRGVVDSLLDPWVYLEAVRDEHGDVVDFRFRDANDAACAANRRTREELVGVRLLDLLPGHAERGLIQAYAAVVDTGQSLTLNDFPYPDELGDGGLGWFDNRAVKVGDGISFSWRDVTERVRTRQSLAREAVTDPLTGLANRSGLEAAAANLFGREPRTGREIAVLYGDLEGLKALNDRYGHGCGDAVLRATAERMVASIRKDDVASRVGGDEFVILAPGMRDLDAAVALAGKVRAAVGQPLTVGGVVLTPTLTLGVAIAARGEPSHAVIERADADLYEQRSRARATARRGVPLATLRPVNARVDEEAFISVVEALSPALMRVAYAFSRDVDAAEAVVRQAWLETIAAGDADLRSEMLRPAALRRVVDRAREALHDEHPWDRAVEDASTPAPTVDPARFRPAGEQWAGGWVAFPSAWPTDLDAAAAVRAALSELPQAQRVVVSLRDEQGCTAQEVCEYLALEADTQRALLHSGRARLRQAVEEHLSGAG